MSKLPGDTEQEATVKKITVYSTPGYAWRG